MEFELVEGDFLFGDLFEAVREGIEWFGEILFGDSGFEGDFGGFEEGLVEEIELFVFLDVFLDHVENLKLFCRAKLVHENKSLIIEFRIYFCYKFKSYRPHLHPIII